MRLKDRQVPSGADVLSIIQGPPIGFSAKSIQSQPEKWGWGHAIVTMCVVSALCWLGFGAIILL